MSEEMTAEQIVETLLAHSFWKSPPLVLKRYFIGVLKAAELRGFEKARERAAKIVADDIKAECGSECPDSYLVKEIRTMQPEGK